MKIVSLMDNLSDRPDITAAHGLSLYLETEYHKILFDFGPDDSFVRNAAVLGVDLTAVDIAVLSHGHYDHGGGLRTFLAINHTSPVYIRSAAFAPLFSGTRYISIDPALRDHPQICLTDGSHHIDEQIQLFSGVTGRRFFADSNRALRMQQPDGSLIPDTFSHEQSLLIQEGTLRILIAGCAHTGIINILERAEHITESVMTHVISGFHLCQPSKGIHEEEATVRAIAAELHSRSARYYTCHCTGLPSYRILRRETQGQVRYLPAGGTLLLSSSPL